MSTPDLSKDFKGGTTSTRKKDEDDDNNNQEDQQRDDDYLLFSRQFWQDQPCGCKIVYVSVGVLILSIIIHRFSFLAFVLWTGVVGFIIAWKLLRWKLGLDTTRDSNHSCDVSKCAMDERGGSGEVVDGTKQACSICGKHKCSFHSLTSSVQSRQPWIGLTLPKKVDNALEEFLTHVLDRFIYDWYRKISSEEAVVDEIRTGLRFVVARLLLRLRKVNLSEFVTKELIPAIVTHLVQHVHSHRKVGRLNADRIRLRRNRVHRSLFTREDELDYLKQLTQSLFPYIFPDNVQTSKPLGLLLEQLVAGVVLLPALDKIADPDFINNLLILLVDEEPPPANPDPASEPVELLSHFSVPNSCLQSFHCYDLGKITTNQTLLVAFTDVMKQNGGLKFLQFFLTLENFKTVLLSGDTGGSDLKQMEDEALHMYRVFCRPEATDFIDLGPEMLGQFKQLAEKGTEGIKELKSQGEFLARAYDYLYNLIDSYYLPIFRHSHQYFTYLYGAKTAKPESSQLPSKTDRRGFSLTTKLRSSFKGDRGGSGLSGSSNSLKDMDNSSPCSTPDCVSLHDEEMADETMTEDLHDMSEWTVELPSISIQLDPRGRANYSFQVKVYKNDPNSTLCDSDVELKIKNGSSVYRNHTDFYNLEQKLKQFHGAKLNSQLPPNKFFATKDHEYLDAVKPKFETFLKDVLNTPDLKSSELLYSFLTARDFSRISMADIRIENVFGKLFKERGQNLKSFLRSFQSSTIPKAPRPDFSKVADSAAESEDKPLIVRHLHNRLYEKSHVRQPSNGVAVEPNNHLLTVSSEASARAPANTVKLSSIVDCILRIAEEVFAIPKTLHWLLTTVVLVGKDWIDALITWYIRSKLEQVLEEHRVESLIKLLQDNVFYGDGLVRTPKQQGERKLKALTDLKDFIPAAVYKIVGDSSETALEEMFEVLQHPKLNKQLIYILLDIVICELFPELNT